LTLKNENISAEDYQLCQGVWEDNDMKTMKEFLTWYNNKDVEPMLEAIDKMFPDTAGSLRQRYFRFSKYCRRLREVAAG
jgi:hypothetical protein